MAAITIGGKGPMSARKKRPPMPAMVGLMLKLGPGNKGDGAPGAKEPQPDSSDDTLSQRNNAEETSAEEKSYHQEGGSPAPTPESVLYHDGTQICSQCEYFHGGNCDFLKIPVDDGGHCQRYEDKTEDQNQGDGAISGMESENQ